MTTPTPEEPPREDNPFRAPDFETASPAVPQFTTTGGYPMAMPPVPAPPPVRRVGTAAKVWIGVGLAVALGVGSLSAFGVAALGTLGSGPSSGSCLYLSDAGSDSQTFHKLSCEDDRATYRVDNVQGAYTSCIGSDYVRFRIYDSRNRPTSSLCLALNVRTGDCLTHVDDETSVAKVGCGSANAEARVTVHDGVSRETVCGERDVPLVYAGPPERTVCLLPTGENI
ncbi:LppU/SCO3897 family protein [Amycolatopsis sp. H20-H5]|uniref:LppU/SCO3897 family protein n=1 Tax=Amycolatopsis sp. H20-H5 TaxID=3046309 RepID=UPI002DBDA686|nr:hypothetical protein [Amycolatopsis sp. H20-H5]MEC3978539.1 hypothetical protein [Amycolatopsis sp. H20-H5]